MTVPVVRWSFTHTGEIKERPMSGVDRGIDSRGNEYADEWESTALELALLLVPDLETWIDAARMCGQSINIAVDLTRDQS